MTRCFGFTSHLKQKSCIFIAFRSCGWDGIFILLLGQLIFNIYIHYFCKPKSPMTSTPNLYINYGVNFLTGKPF